MIREIRSALYSDLKLCILCSYKWTATVSTETILEMLIYFFILQNMEILKSSYVFIEIN